MIYNFVETYQGIFEGGNRENREVWCCSKGRGGDDEIQPVKESIIETTELPAKITVTVDLTLVSQKDGGTINVVADQKKNPLPSEWNLKCGISGQNRYILICEVERTEKVSKELAFAPIFPLGYIKEYVSLRGYPGISTERLTFVSEKIENCGGKKIKWIDIGLFVDQNCYSKGLYDGNASNDVVCCNEPLGVKTYWCESPTPYWCRAKSMDDLKDLEKIGSGTQKVNFTDCSGTDKGEQFAALWDRWVKSMNAKDTDVPLSMWCCSKGGGGDDEIQPVKPIIETPKPPAETKPIIVCTKKDCKPNQVTAGCEHSCKVWEEKKEEKQEEKPPAEKPELKCKSNDETCTRDGDCCNNKCTAGNCGGGEKGYVEKVVDWLFNTNVDAGKSTNDMM